MSQIYLEISLASQQCQLWDNEQLLFSAPVSTALNGAGEQIDSGCTPRGWHRIRACIGEGLPVNTVFRGRRPTGEVYTAEMGLAFAERDWILTRILWLSGLEPGKNRFGNVDTMRRYIYIHGTPVSEPMGVARSHGCIRMHNEDLLALFELVRPGTKVLIHE